MEKYLIIVNCKDDLEKKRVDYVIEKWRVPKVKGFVLKLDELNKEFIAEIYSKLVEGDVEIYKLHPIKEAPPISKTSEQFRAYCYGKDLGSVVKLIMFIFSKINAVSGDVNIMDKMIYQNYTVYVRGKGKVDVEIRMKEERDKVLIEFKLEGPEDAVNAFAYDLARDLKFFDVEVDL